jgi:opacity protein-like surface antigen
MRKLNVFVILTVAFFALPPAALAAYPTYPAYPAQGQQYRPGVVQLPMHAGQRVVAVQSNQQILTQPVQPVLPQPVQVQAAPTQPVRVTGGLPRVGSNASSAGRQYYQPADYDRLVDSGLYISLGVGYSASISGSMIADYKGEEKSYVAPGAFKAASYNSDTVIPMQVAVGAAINNDVRVDFSYSRYRGIEYPKEVETDNGAGEYTKAKATGGAITANATMLNVFYNIDSYTGYMAGGQMRPYIGAGVGISFNTISDYVVLDKQFYSVLQPDQAAAGVLTAISDIYAYHSGGTVEQLAYMLEGGVTTELDGGVKLDFFVRYSGLGKVKNSGSIVVSQTEWLGDGAGGEQEAPYDTVFHYTNWQESGNLSTIDVGIRARLQF